MACDVFDGLTAMNESLSQDIAYRLQWKDPFYSLIRRGTYKPNSGYEQTTFVLEGSQPESVAPDWSAIGPVTEENTEGPCSITYEDTYQGFSKRVYGPEQRGLKGPVFCKDEFTFDFMPDTWVDRYVDNLALLSHQTWSNRFIQHYMSLANKYVAGYGDTVFTGQTLAPTDAAATLPAHEATSQLTFDMMDWTALKIIRAGGMATEKDPAGFIDMGPSGPVFAAYMSPEMINTIVRNNPDLRLDLRYSNMGAMSDSILVQKFGATVVLKNWRLIPWAFPPRFNWDGSKYVQVETWIKTAASGKGYKPVVNPDWENADFEAAVHLHPLVFESEIVQPQVNAGGLPFEPTNYAGEWDFRVGAYRIGLSCDDPKDKFGRHFAEFKHAVNPTFPEYGNVWIYKRCQNESYTVSCS